MNLLALLLNDHVSPEEFAADVTPDLAGGLTAFDQHGAVLGAKDWNISRRRAQHSQGVDDPYTQAAPEHWGNRLRMSIGLRLRVMVLLRNR